MHLEKQCNRIQDALKCKSHHEISIQSYRISVVYCRLCVNLWMHNFIIIIREQIND